MALLLLLFLLLNTSHLLNVKHTAHFVRQKTFNYLQLTVSFTMDYRESKGFGDRRSIVSDIHSITK